MISVVILTKNEEKNIIDCIESVSWADEIVIIDDFSLDRTVEVVNNLIYSKKIKIFQRKLNQNFSAQRNFALSKVKHEWVLFIDADEIVTKDLKEEINSIIISKEDKYNGYYIKREDVIWGKHIKHGEFGNIRLLRFAKKNSGDWVGDVHERWVVDEPATDLEAIILHYPHQNVTDFLKEINFYTTIRANELYKNNIKTNVFEILLYPKGKFLLNYIFKLGFLDNIEGLILAIFMSFHSFLVRGKLWLLWVKK